MQLLRRAGEIRRAVKEFLFGMFFYGLYQQALHLREKYENIFYTLLMTELLGFPMTGNYYTLRLLPYVVGELENIRRRLLRETDLLELLHEGPAAH